MASLLFSGCTMESLSPYKHSNNTLRLGNDQDPVIVKLQNVNYRSYPGWCIDSSFTLTQNNKEYGNLFVESIDLNSKCKWNGSPSGYFEYDFISKLKLNGVKTVENIEVGRYTFRTLQIEEEYFNIISSYVGDEETFIVDYDGKLYDKVLRSFKKEYVNKYLDKKRFYGYYNDSLVRKNFYNHYYAQENERFEK